MKINYVKPFAPKVVFNHMGDDEMFADMPEEVANNFWHECRNQEFEPAVYISSTWGARKSKTKAVAKAKNFYQSIVDVSVREDMGLSEVTWTSMFALVQDKYGVDWMISVGD